MKQPIDLRPDHAKIVHEIIARHLPAGVSVRVFGSRAKWTAKPHSDLDLALKGKQPLPRSMLVDLAEAFSESDLPFRVDVVDWHTVAPSFQAVIDRDGKRLEFPFENIGNLASENNGAIAIGPFGSAMKADTYTDSGVRVIRGTNFGDTRTWKGDWVFVPDSFVEKMPRCEVRPGDIVFPHRGSIGEVAIVPDDGNRYCLSTSLMKATLDPKKSDPLFVCYYLKSPAGRQEIMRFGSTVGTPGIGQPLASLRQFNVPSPDLSTQKSIVSVLTALDDKIELNRRMNETLEGMAQAIFRDWFVDFGPVRRKAAGDTDAVAIVGGLIPNAASAAKLAALFPAALGDDGLPVGWQRLHLSDIASQGKGSVNPQGQPETVFEHYSLPAFDKGQEPSMDAGSTIKSNKTPVPSGAVLLSKLNPETLRVWLPNDHAGAVQIASTEFLVFIPKLGASRSLLFALFRDPDFRTLMQGMVTGTSKSHQRISPPALLAQDVIAADVGLFPAFSALVEPMLERLLANRAENKFLAETRDYLLPRLMSGTVRVARESEAA